MRITIKYRSNDAQITCDAVALFFSYHLATAYYGEDFDSIEVGFVDTSNTNKKLKRRLLYGEYVEIEVEQKINLTEAISIQEFKKVFYAFKEALHHLEEIKFKAEDIDINAFKEAIENLETQLPKTEAELNHWLQKNSINREIVQLIYNYRNTNQDFDRRQQAKQIPLREINMSFDALSFFATNEEKEKDRLHQRRKKEIPICWIQAEFMTRYIRDEARKLKFKGQYHTVSIGLSNRYEIQKGKEGVTILIPFDQEKYKQVYPTYEVDVPLKTIISNENENQVNLFIANLILDGLAYAKKENLYLPIDQLVQIIENFIATDFNYEWNHKSRVFKEFGIKARLHCRLTNHAFYLDIVLLKGKHEFFRKEIHKSQPWKEAWRNFYEDIVLDDGHLVVTRQYAVAKPIFKISHKELENTLTH